MSFASWWALLRRVWVAARESQTTVLGGAVCVIASFVAVGLLVFPRSAQAICKPGHMINPVSDVAWQCIFPVSIMGIPFDGGNHPPDDETTQAFCDCPGKNGTTYGFGFVVGFWEPARMMDTVTDAWCFPGLGMDMAGEKVGWGYTGGGQLRYAVEDVAFQMYHYYIMPMWAILELFSDIPCVDDGDSFDIAMVSELRPDWGNDMLAEELNPDTSLFANPFVVLACAADAVAATFEQTIDALYWCMGSWGTTYPVTGHITASDYVEANAGIAAKAMYLQGRWGQLGDRAVNVCATTYMPIWVKSHWRIQEVDPIADPTCHLIGHPGILWTAGKNPVGTQDNYSWLLFRKVQCCVAVF